MQFPFSASRSSHSDHLIPLWLALEPEERGTFYVSNETLPLVREAGVTDFARGRPPKVGGPVVVASYDDLQAAGNRPVVMVQHGVGQSYTGSASRHGSYAGGLGRERVVLFLHPSEYAARPDKARYPDATHEVVGAPKLDSLFAVRKFETGNTTVGFAFHADFSKQLKVPELRPAVDWYAGVLKEKPWPYRTLGHGHPRWWGRLKKFYDTCPEVEPVPRFEDVIGQVGVFAADNTSVLYEAAALDVPVVVLNAPWFRRDVQHGLRFWEFADVGVQVDEPSDLHEALAVALTDEPGRAERRREVSAVLYANRGSACQWAVDALRTLAVEQPELWETIEDVDRTNPYAPIERGQQLPARLPEGRLRRLGAPDELVLDVRSRFYGLPEERRVHVAAALAVVPDGQLLAQVNDVLADAGAVKG